MIVPLMLLSGAGFMSLHKLLRWGFLPVIGFCVALALNQLFIQTPTDYPWYAKQVYADVVKEVGSLKKIHPAIVAQESNYIYFLFYLGISPSEFVNDANITPLSATNKWHRVNRVSNIYLKMPVRCPHSGKANVVYVCTGVEVPRNAKILKVFYYQDRVPAYSLITFYPISQMPSKLPELPSRFEYMQGVETKGEYPDGIIPDDYPSMF